MGLRLKQQAFECQLRMRDAPRAIQRRRGLSLRQFGTGLIQRVLCGGGGIVETLLQLTRGAEAANRPRIIAARVTSRAIRFRFVCLLAQQRFADFWRRCAGGQQQRREQRDA